MKVRALFFLLLLIAGFSECQKSRVSKIPNIALDSATEDIEVNIDTMFIHFTITDGDADLGNDPKSVIYWKDKRYDTMGFMTNDFPEIDKSVEDPTKGLKAACEFIPPLPLVPRLDSVHLLFGDTTTYEIYVKDRAGNESNHITTKPVFMHL